MQGCRRTAVAGMDTEVRVTAPQTERCLQLLQEHRVDYSHSLWKYTGWHFKDAQLWNYETVNFCCPFLFCCVAVTADSPEELKHPCTI